MQLDNYRACCPSETLERVTPFLPRLGITRLARQTGLDDIGIAVWCAYAPNAKAIVIAQGKGIDDDAARTSAAMEAIERAVATNPSCSLRLASRLTLETEGQTVHALDCLLSPHSQAVAPGEEINWVCATDLLNLNTVWLPYDAVHLDRTLLAPRYWLSSDGLASGNTREEAILHGLLERVERDALTIWQVTPAARRYQQAIDTKSITEPQLREALDRIEQAGLDITLFDITTDLAIPCLVALLGPKDRSAPQSLRYVDVTLGAGASTKPAVAAMRAITEAVQSRMTFIGGARDDLLPDMFTQRADAVTVQAMDARPRKTLCDLPELEAASTEHSLQAVLNRLQSQGISELFAVDLSPEWLPASVVKVIATQLENPDGDRKQLLGRRALSMVL